jgi:glycosyltransferase involved in cell wall biosynthesis
MLSPDMTGVLAGITAALYATVGFVAVGSVAYLLFLLASAAWRRRTPSPGTISRRDASDCHERFVIVVPAHNEEMVIGATLSHLSRLDYPADKFEVVVVADNCTDRTAEIARAAGATILERTNQELRGKGYALDWAFDRLMREDAGTANEAAAFVVVDADTVVDPGFLRAMADRIWSGVPVEKRHARRAALQGRYGVLNPEDSWRASLMTAAFDLFNHVKPLGRDRLGLSVGLKGNGMAFTRTVLKAAAWQGRSITEDIDFGIDLLLHHGIVVGYVPEAKVQAQMPVTSKQAASQRERWEKGRYKLLRQRAIPLLTAGVRRHDFRLIDAAIDLMLSPLAELAALHAVWLILADAGTFFGLLPMKATIPPVVSCLGYALYVLGGLKLAGATKREYAALLRAPLYTVWKLVLLFRPGRGKGRRTDGDGPSGGNTGAEEWVRTERTAMPPAAPTPVKPTKEGAAL